MKKIFLVLFISAFVIQAQDKTFSFKTENSFFHDNIDCFIGSKIRLDDIFVNLNSVEKIEAGLFTLSGKFIKSIDYKDSLTGRSPRTLLVKINYKLDYDSTCYLVIKVNARDYFSKILYTGYDHWIIRPKYPLLTPILMDTLYCGRKFSFSFASLGQDEDTLYSYEIIDDSTNNKVIEGKGSLIVLDSLMNTQTLFKHKINIKGLYAGKSFNYKYTSKTDKINLSEWNTVIRGPRPPDLKYESIVKEYEGENALYVPFVYKVGEMEYTPDVGLGRDIWSVYSERLQRNLIKGREVVLSGAAIVLKSFQNYLGKIIIEFDDQYNPLIKIPIEIK
jgi:hypothetical protein